MRTSFPPSVTCSDFAIVAGECVHAAADRLLAVLTDLPDLELAPSHQVPEQPLHDRADRHRSITRIDTPRRRA